VTITKIANLNDEITDQGDDLDYEVDQMISQMLSAATDNAKELILAKINASPDLAKIYFFGLIMGFSLNDLAAFMTSNTVNSIVSLGESDMFNPNLNKMNVKTVVNALASDNYYAIYSSFLGNYYSRLITKWFNNYGKKDHEGKKVVLIEGNWIGSLDDFIKCKLDNKIKMSLKEFILNYIPENGKRVYISSEDEDGVIINFKDEARTNVQRLSKYIDYFVEKASNIDKDDLTEFKELWNCSNELTRLTNTFL